MYNSNKKPADIINKKYWSYAFFTAKLLQTDANKPLQITIENDSEFLWESTTFFCDIAGAAQEQATRVLPLITMQMKDTSSGALVFNKALPLPAIAGDGQFPFILPEPRLLPEKTTLTIELSNYSAAIDYDNVYVILNGTKIYYKGM